MWFQMPLCPYVCSNKTTYQSNVAQLFSDYLEDSKKAQLQAVGKSQTLVRTWQTILIMLWHKTESYLLCVTLKSSWSHAKQH